MSQPNPTPGTSDELVPYSMSHDLLALSPAPSKRHLPIPNAGHNDIFSTGYHPIAQALTQLLQQVNTTAAPTTRP